MSQGVESSVDELQKNLNISDYRLMHTPHATTAFDVVAL